MIHNHNLFRIEIRKTSFFILFQNKVGKFFGKCNEIDVLMLKCMKKERQARRDANAHRAKIEREDRWERMKEDKNDYSQFFKK